MIAIKRVDADGQLDTMYAHPTSLPFSKAETPRVGNDIKLFLELTAGGCNESTYNLANDPANDTLHGVCDQAVVKRVFEMQFARAE